MRPTARRVGVVPICLSALLAAGAAFAQAKPVKVGLSSAFSGHVGFIGADARRGIELAIEELKTANTAVAYELSIADDECTPAGGATAFRRLMDVQQVDVIIGSGCSGATLGGMPTLMDGKLSAVTYGSTNPKITEGAGVGGNPYMWRMNLNDTIIGETFAAFIAKDGVKSAHILAVNNDFGRGAAGVYQALLPKNDVKVNGADFFSQGASDLRALISKIAARSPDAILLFGEPPDCALMARQKREMNLKAKIFSRGGCYTDESLKLMGDPRLGDGLTEAAYWARTPDQPMVEAYRKRHGDYPPYNAALAYYAMMTVDQAVRKAGPSRDGITKGLAQVDWKSAIGPIKFDANHQARPDLFMVRIENGEQKVIETISNAR